MKNNKLSRLLALGPQPKPRKPMSKLQAHANRLTPSAYDDYEEEPSTKLSTAFVVVLVLHLVAVGGVYAFHSIKAQRREADGTATVANAAQAPLSPAVPPTAASTVHPPQAAVPPTATKQPGSVAVKSEGSGARGSAPLVAPAGPSSVLVAPKTGASQSTAPVATVAAKAQPGSVTPVKAAASVPAIAPVPPAVVAGNEAGQKTYTVVKGDNPVAIAKKMGVNYDEMLKLNGVEDPKKLRIGQVLKMPAKKQGN